MTTAAAADDAGDSFPQNLSSAEHLDGGRPPGRGAAEVKMQHLMLIFPPKNWHSEVHCTAFTWFSPLPRAHFVHKVYFHKTQPRPSSLSHRSYKMWSIVNVTFIRFCWISCFSSWCSSSKENDLNDCTAAVAPHCCWCCCCCLTPPSSRSWLRLRSDCSVSPVPDTDPEWGV